MFDFRNQDVVGDYYDFNRDTYEHEGIAANSVRGKVGNGGYTREQVNGGSVGRYEASASGEKLYHKVKYGETLSSIAEKRGVSERRSATSMVTRRTRNLLQDRLSDTHNSVIIRQTARHNIAK